LSFPAWSLDRLIERLRLECLSNLDIREPGKKNDEEDTFSDSMQDNSHLQSGRFFQSWCPLFFRIQQPSLAALFISLLHVRGVRVLAVRRDDVFMMRPWASCEHLASPLVSFY